MRREFWACSLVILFITQSWVITGNELTEIKSSHSYQEDQLFNQSGFFEDGVYTTTDGEAHVSRPTIQWTTPNDLLTIPRSGACSVAVESLNEVWLMGGRMDPNPSQSNDESPTNLVEKLDNQNKTWVPSVVGMPNEQQYCEAEMVGDLVVVVGDWFRNSNPVQYPTGMVQIYNFANNTWYNGTSMPSNDERGLGGMAEANGYLFYAGGLRNPNANDATNKTFRYDPINNSWTRMADMNQARAGFELINFHGQLYAIGGFQGTQTWNRQALDYVESYDPATDTWTNLSAIPKGMYGWAGTVHNDEIVLVGGFNNNPQRSVYQWNPVEDTWSVGANIGSPGHYDLEVESINGSIIWASGDMSINPYSTWQQSFSVDTEYQNESDSHSGWITSPVIDLRPNVNGKAAPVQFELLGSSIQGGEIGFQYRAGTSSAILSTLDWIGSDGTVNTEFPKGITDIDLVDYADFLQYRIKMTVTDLPNWGEPDLDSLSVRAEHAAFMSPIPVVLHPRAETITIQTSHDITTAGEMYLELAPCDSFGAILGVWSRLSHDGSSYSESDTQGLFIQSSGAINSSSIGETIIDWSIDLGDLTGVSNLCVKVGSSGAETLEYVHPSNIEIDNLLQVSITGIQDLSSGDATTGGYPLQIGVNHSFPTTGMTLSSGDVQARMTFQIHVLDPVLNNYTNWVNQTTPWTDLTIGQTDIIPWSLPTDISGMVEIILESRSDQPFQMLSNSNSWQLLLDNENPIMISSNPVNGSYIDSMEDRELSILVADTSGFSSDEVSLEVWVQGLDDGTDGSIPDGTPQDTEYRAINHTIENIGSRWWFNASQSDDENLDSQLVYLRIVGVDNVGITIVDNTIWWSTRDATNAVIDSLSKDDQVQNWEVSRNISWQVAISDSNSIYDIMNLKIELGDDSDFGVIYDIADSSCSSLDYRIDSDRTTCSHTINGEEMIVSLSLFAGWDVDLSVLTEGMVEFTIEDRDGISKYTYQNLWIFSQDFDFTITGVSDEGQPVTGEITNESILRTSESIAITGTMSHSLSGTPYQGDLSVSWWGLLQGESWFGGGTISVVDGVINASIPMPSTGGIMDMSVSFMDPWGTTVIQSHELPVFQIDADAPVILQSETEEFSRYHLDNFGFGVNIVESLSWTGELELACQVISSNIEWPIMVISSTPSNYFQDKAIFSYNFDFSGQGDPSLLSPEAQIDCWAAGTDDSGWDLVGFGGDSLIDPWMTFPLSTVGPNIELLDVKLDGNIEPGNEIKVEITIKNTGEELDDPFNITVYTISDDEKTLVWKFSQSKIGAGEGMIKRVSITVPKGDWTLEVNVDEEQQISELNENDNSFSKEYSAPEEFDFMVYGGVGSGIAIVFLIVFILKRRNKDEFSEVKKMPSIDELPRTGPPQEMRSKSPPPKTPKKGPPPKKPVNAPNPTLDISNAMAKLSLDTLPGASSSQPEKVSSYESLPGGGDYEYLGEGTYYSGEGIGKWKLEEDGSFTKME